MGGHDPYSSSKACAELVTSAYRDSYFSQENYVRHGVALASARAGNIIAGGDWAEDRLIPDSVRAFMANRPVGVRNPNAFRPWQHVLEPLNGYLCLAEKLWQHGSEFAEAWNFGPTDEDVRPVSWILQKLTELWGDGASWEPDISQHPQEATYLKLDCSKAKNRLGWAPKISLVTALEWTVAWYKDYQRNQDMRYVTEAEIKRFEDLQYEE
jgi:CDP-glucose 4,6-dehydratase